MGTVWPFVGNSRNSVPVPRGPLISFTDFHKTVKPTSSGFSVTAWFGVQVDQQVCVSCGVFVGGSHIFVFGEGHSCPPGPCCTGGSAAAGGGRPPAPLRAIRAQVPIRLAHQEAVHHPRHQAVVLLRCVLRKVAPHSGGGGASGDTFDFGNRSHI